MEVQVEGKWMWERKGSVCVDDKWWKRKEYGDGREEVRVKEQRMKEREGEIEVGAWRWKWGSESKEGELWRLR